MKLAAIAKLIKADEYCKLYKVIYDVGSNYDLYIGTKTAIFPLTGFPKAQNESELATLLGISKKEWADIQFGADYCPNGINDIEGMSLEDTADGEMDCVTGRISIRYCGCELLPMIEPTSGTVGFVDAKQIMPVADEIRKSGYFKYCVRKMASGGRYYVIKDGMVVRGAMLPVKLEPATKLIERLKEERTHSLASEAWNPALVGTMLELKTKHILGEIISVLEEEPAADVVPCPAPNWPICQNCGKPMVYCGEEKTGDIVWKRYSCKDCYNQNVARRVTNNDA